ncbi:MAG: translation initiation factor IF-2 [Elusimicrobia bacterium]|nr:translation initiation factor IF-2 [Elusimicrobiota bacterium]
MAKKIRIHELAKELGIDYKLVLKDAKTLGIEAKTHQSAITEEEADLIKGSLKGPKNTSGRKKTVKKKTVKPKAAPKKKTSKAKPAKEKAAPQKAVSKKKPEKPKKKPDEAVPPPAKAAVQEPSVIIKTAPPAAPKPEPERAPKPIPEPVREETVKKPQAPEKVREIRKRAVIEPAMTTAGLAEKLDMSVEKLIAFFREKNFFVTPNQRINVNNTKLVLDGIGYEAEVKGFYGEDDLLNIERKSIRPRAPIVTVMGHVDHGKTQLLDTIRHSNVIAKESGGITQHIGAYKVKVKNDEITFIDTPGHEAFTAMRARGSQITDIVVLVVAGDDGVMPQTIEAINHAKAANVPIIVAINKSDLPEFNAKKVRTQLSKYNVVTEEWGGEVISVEISAKENRNVDELLEMIVLQSQMMELKAAVDGPAVGMVIESELDKWIGPTATVVIREGTLSTGDAFVCGSVSGKVKSLTDEGRKTLKSAGPSTPVRIFGFEELPQTGDILEVVKDKTFARDISEKRKEQLKKTRTAPGEKITLEDIKRQLLGEESKELRIILKTDVIGSLEAIKDSLAKLKSDEIRLNIIHSGVGTVTKHDIMLAAASNAIVFGFNISVPGAIKSESEKEGIQIRTYRIIYEILEDIQKALEGMLEPEKKEVVAGQALIKEIFNISGTGTVAGCMVQSGVIKRTSPVRVIRDSKIVYEGRLASLRRFKNNANEVAEGYECGMNIDNFNDIKVGDVIESFNVEKHKRTLEDAR